MDSSPKSAQTAVMVIRHGDMPEPLDFTTPALDLCVRGRKRSPSPEGAQYNTKSEPIYIEPTTTTFCFSSPGSHADSEVSDTSSCSDLNKEYANYPNGASNINMQQKAKIPRPFKAYPKDPLSLAVGVATAEAILGQDSAEAYNEFRKRMLSQVQSSNIGTNKNMRRNTQKDVGSNIDPTYWEKRRKNNEAAKRSRDARRAKEDEIAIRCAYLEQENLKLRYEVAALRNESERLRNLVYH